MPEKTANGSLHKLDTTTRLAFERTRLSYDRTVMSSVRTSTSLITFGFTVYKFFQLELKRVEVPEHIIGPREFGLTMIIIGLLSLSLGTYEYVRDLRLMRKDYPDMPRSTAGVVAGFVAALGVTALLVLIFRK